MPTNKSKKKKSESAASGNSQGSPSDAQGNEENILVPNPEWVGIAPLPTPERYHVFDPPRAFYDAMMADRDSWAVGVDFTVARTVCTAIWRTCLPWWLDWHTWQAHATEFFNRLCAHRRLQSQSHADELQELRARVEALEKRLTTAEAQIPRVVRSETATTANGGSETATSANGVDGTEVRTRGRSPQVNIRSSTIADAVKQILRGVSPVSNEPMEETTLRAQLIAAAARSPSPSASLHQLIRQRAGD